MIWIIVIESIVILIMGWMIWDAQKSIRILVDMWAEEKSRQWLQLMKESGAEIVVVKGDD